MKIVIYNQSLLTLLDFEKASLVSFKVFFSGILFGTVPLGKQVFILSILPLTLKKIYVLLFAFPVPDLLLILPLKQIAIFGRF